MPQLFQSRYDVWRKGHHSLIFEISLAQSHMLRLKSHSSGSSSWYAQTFSRCMRGGLCCRGEGGLWWGWAGPGCCVKATNEQINSINLVNMTCCSTCCTCCNYFLAVATDAFLTTPYVSGIGVLLLPLQLFHIVYILTQYTLFTKFRLFPDPPLPLLMLLPIVLSESFLLVQKPC